jgi:hypothetical protein
MSMQVSAVPAQISAQLSNWLKSGARQLAAMRRANATRTTSEAQSLESRAVEQAHQDWLVANRLFDYATEPELVDYAIYALQAAERQYVYLWKKARERL